MNREVFPGGIYPLSGDVQSTAGSNTVRVIGLSGISLSGVPTTQNQVYAFDVNSGTFLITSIPVNQSIQCNGVGMSDDYYIFCNNCDMEIQVNSSFPPNGKPIFCNGVGV